MALHDEHGVPNVRYGLVPYVVGAVLGFAPGFLFFSEAISFVASRGESRHGDLFGFGLIFGGRVYWPLVALAFLASAAWCRRAPGRWRVHLIGLGIMVGPGLAIIAIVAFFVLLSFAWVRP